MTLQDLSNTIKQLFGNAQAKTKAASAKTNARSEAARNYIIKDGRYSPVAQVRSVIGMDNNQAQDYRKQVTATVPTLKLSDSRIPFTQTKVGDVPIAGGAYRYMAEPLINSVPNAVAGMAKLPGARNFSQGASDVGAIGEGALTMLSLGAGGVAKNAVKQTLKQRMLAGGIKGAGTGAMYGGLEGARVSENNTKNMDTVANIAKSTGIGAGAGFILGAAQPLAEEGVKKAVKFVAKETKNQKGFLGLGEKKKQTIADIQNQGGRANHQLALEEAFKKNDLEGAQKIIDGIPDEDPYKQPMQNILNGMRGSKIPSAFDKSSGIIRAPKPGAASADAGGGVVTIDSPFASKNPELVKKVNEGLQKGHYDETMTSLAEFPDGDPFKDTVQKYMRTLGKQKDVIAKITSLDHAGTMKYETIKLSDVREHLHAAIKSNDLDGMNKWNGYMQLLGGQQEVKIPLGDPNMKAPPFAEVSKGMFRLSAPQKVSVNAGKSYEVAQPQSLAKGITSIKSTGGDIDIANAHPDVQNALDAINNQMGGINLDATVGKVADQKVQISDIKAALASGAISPDEASLYTGSLSPVDKITQILKTAKPIRGAQEKLYSQERAKRVARVAAVGESVPGEGGYHAQLGQLKGEMPKVQFEGIRDQVDQTDIDALFNQVQDAPMSPFEKVTAKTGLAKVLGAQGGAVPNRSELKLLNEVFPADFIKTVMDKRSLTEKLFSGGGEALNLPREVMATADLSAPLRQGAFLVGRPKQFFPAFKEMFKDFASEDNYQALQSDIRSRPTYQAMRENNLAITDMSPILGNREEAFMSNLGEKIPGFGVVAKASNRAYSGFLNKLRADTFDDLLKHAKEQGVAQDNPKVAADIAKFVNSATGRGDLGMLQKAAPVLNGMFFSPRLMASRLNLLNPMYYASLEPFVRKEALKSLLSFSGTALTIAGLAKLGGADVSADPRSADFGKIKIGNTRYDPWGGFQQYIVGGARLISGQMVSSTTGKEFNLGEGYKPTTRFDIAQKLLESKEAPVASFITGLLRGTTATGEKFNPPAEVINRFIPLIAQDLEDLQREYGIVKGSAMAIPGAFGVGSQTYGDQVPIQTTTPAGKPKIDFRQPPSLGEQIINKATGTQTSNVPQEQWAGLNDQRLSNLKDQAEIDKAKTIVLETGKPMTVGSTTIYLDKGIVKTKSVPGSKSAPSYTPTAPNTYTASNDAPKDVLSLVGTYAKALSVDPQNALKAMFTEEELRKVTGNAAILERQNGLASMDNGDKSTQIDHIIALSLGGTNDKSNLRALPAQENLAKGVVETYLYKLLKSGAISKAEAQKRDLNWKQEIDNLPTQDRARATAVLNTQSLTQPTQVADEQTADNGKPLEYETIINEQTSKPTYVLKNRPIYEPKLTGLPELDKLEYKKRASSIAGRISDIGKLRDAKKMNDKAANDEIVKLRGLQSKGGSGRARKGTKVVIKSGKKAALPTKLTFKRTPLSGLKFPKITAPTTKSNYKVGQSSRMFTIKA